MPANDVFEMSVDQTLENQNLTNLYHFIQTSSDGSGDARAAVNALWTLIWKTLYLATVTAAVDMIQTRVRRIQPTQTQTLITANAGAGAIVGEALPPQSCAILRQYATPLARRGTGHVKISGIDVAASESGRIDVAQETLINAFAAPMTSDQTEVASGYVFRMGVYSQVDQVLRPIQSALALGRIKTVYSRSIGVGT